jgi:hypothetical protein
MIAGHFGLAAGVKGEAPSVPLWALMLACQWLDVVFAVLFAAGVEGLAPIAGAKPGAYGAAIINADYTHSLVGAAILSLLFGAVAGIRYGRRSAVVLGLVVFSHWILDLFMHRADMPILPGGAGGLPRVGFGLWRYPVWSALLELVFVVGGAVLYARAAYQVAGADARAARRARLCSGGVLGAGLLTLALNFIGM